LIQLKIKVQKVDSFRDANVLLHQKAFLLQF